MADDLAVLRVQMEAQTAAFEKGMAQASRAVNKFQQDTKGLTSAFDGVQGAFFKFNQATNALQTGMGLIGKAFSAFRDLGKAREGVLVLQGSLEALLGSSERAADMLDRVYNIAGDLGVPVDTVTDAVKRMSLGLNALGASNVEIENVTKNFLKIGASGGSVQEASGAIFQFSQALGSGALRGDEMISLLERVPTVAQHIAKYLGTTIGGLRKMGSEGKVTSQILFDALNNAGDAGEKFAKIPKTIAQNMAQLSVSATKFKVAFAETFQINEKSTEIIQAFAGVADKAFGNMILFMKDVKKYSEEVKVGLAALTIALSGPLISAIYAVGAAITAVIIANPFTAVAAAAVAAAALIITHWKEVKTFVLEATVAILEPLLALEKFLGKDLGIASTIGEANTSLALLAQSEEAAASGAGDLRNAVQASNTVSKEQEKAAKAAASAIEAHKEAMINLRMELVKATSSGLDKYQENEILRNMRIAEGLDVITEARFREQQAIQQVLDLKAKESAHDKEMQGWVDTYDKLGAAARKFADDLQKIDDLFFSEKIDETTYVRMMKQLVESAKEVKNPLDEIGVAIGNTLSQGVSSLVDGFFDMKKSFADTAADFLKNIAKMIAQTLILKAIQASLKGTGVGSFLGFAKGGAFSQTTGLPYGVYDKPTYFNMPGSGPLQKFAKGGVLGEAGPEAIMPLARGRDGKLGVAGGGTTVNVYNSADVTVKTAESTREDGQTQIDIIIERKVKELFGQGSMDKTMRASYGLNRSAT